MTLDRRVSAQTVRAFKMSLPIFAELLLQLLVGNVDQVMLSHFAQSSVAAVGNGNQIMNVVIIVMDAMSAATTILMAQYIGAKEEGQCGRVCVAGFVIVGTFSLLAGLVLLCFPGTLFTLLRTPADAFAEACLYTRVVGGAVILQGCYFVFCAALRSFSLLREVMISAVVMNCVNIAGNAILINGLLGAPRLGVLGAAISTDLSKLLGLCLAARMFRKKCGVRLHWGLLRPFPRDMVRKILAIAMPSGVEALSYNVSQIFILRFINLMGTAVIATKVYAGIFANIAYVDTIAIAQATQILIGYLLGGRQLDEVDQRVWSTMRIALLMSEAITLLIFIFSAPLYGIFTDDRAILALGRQILIVEFFLEIGRSVNIVMVRSLTAAGDVWYPVTVGIVFQWLVAAMGSWLLGSVLGLGLVGVWIAMACDECFRGVLFVRRFRHGDWREKRLVDVGPPEGQAT